MFVFLRPVDVVLQLCHSLLHFSHSIEQQEEQRSCNYHEAEVHHKKRGQVPTLIELDHHPQYMDGPPALTFNQNTGGPQLEVW